MQSHCSADALWGILLTSKRAFAFIYSTTCIRNFYQWQILLYFPMPIYVCIRTICSCSTFWVFWAFSVCLVLWVFQTFLNRHFLDRPYPTPTPLRATNKVVLFRMSKTTSQGSSHLKNTRLPPANYQWHMMTPIESKDPRWLSLTWSTQRCGWYLFWIAGAKRPDSAGAADQQQPADGRGGGGGSEPAKLPQVAVFSML